MPEVRLEKGESIDKALKRLKKQLEKEGILRELKEKEFYEKPSQRRRKKFLKARKKIAYARRYAQI